MTSRNQGLSPKREREEVEREPGTWFITNDKLEKFGLSSLVFTRT